ncbi:bestrophin family protein [Nodosilinea nodulosa]|uniref:bestrophin family protein n=1 Tax=Nodosilinea nodulosa TaxID=416001 RepID=UPI0002F326AB|nr:bestrophin family ion channel [Nodosilinea nodulosa]
MPDKPIKRNVRRYEQDWFKLLFRVRGSVIPAVMPRVLLCAAFSLGILLLHGRGWPVSSPILGSLVPSLVLGLLLVFRTNTSYERFWEGRKLWGNVVNLTRNLARQMWVAIATPQPADHEAKKAAIHLLPAFAIAMKLHLRGEPPNSELVGLLTADQCAQLRQMHNPPLEIAFWVADYLQTQQGRGTLNPHQLTYCLETLDGLVNALGGCERILKTPMPVAYSIHLKQLLMLYCLALPFQMVASVGWATPFLVGLISFAVFGIEEIGIEIENPFGHDPNDLPLDLICRTMQQNIEDLMSLVPGVGRSHQAAVESTADNAEHRYESKNQRLS